MNYLQLCQMVARESGTVSGTQPLAVTNQSGRLLKIVSWVASAWTKIQNTENAWQWMQGEFSGETTAGAARYTNNSFNLSRWAAWLVSSEEERNQQFSIYLQATGVSDENWLCYKSWQEYRTLYGIGSQTNNRPVHYAISPAGELCLGPVPDDTYVVRGQYRKGAQTLAANTDTPEIPERFHELIGWYALLLLQENDEAEIPIISATRRYADLLSALRRDQLPMITLCGPLA